MKTQFENLNNAVNLGLVNLNDFYSVTFTEHSINLQGKFKSELVRAYGTFETDANGFLCAKVTLCDVEFKITLTD
jgi:hypothetical protein